MILCTSLLTFSGRQYIQPAAQTILVRLAQVVSLGHASPWTQGSRKDPKERRTRWTPPSGPEKILEMTLLEGSFSPATADQSSQQMFVDTKSPVTRGLHKSAGPQSTVPTGQRTQLTCHIPAQKLPDAHSSYCPLLPKYVVHMGFSLLTDVS